MPRKRNYRCRVHIVGRNPDGAVPYDPDCPVCIEKRGHLPPEERDIPGLARYDKARRWVGGLYHMDRRRM